MVKENETCLSISSPLGKSLLALTIAAVLYFAIGAFTLSPAYVDFGDGNYLYISKRISQGVRLYRDIVSPQPPLHLFLGAGLLALGKRLGSELYTVRLFLLFWHLATMALVAAIAWRLTRKALTTFISGVVFLLLPIGFWWSRGYQSENWVVFWITLCFYLLLPVDGKGARSLEERCQISNLALASAGLLSVVALFTNMTALPYIFLFALTSSIRFRVRSLWYFIPFAVVSVGAFLVMHLYSQGTYLENVWANQVGTYPKQGTLNYFLHKLSSQGLKIIQLEGGYLILSLIGLGMLLKTARTKDEYFVVWHCLSSLGSILFVTKGGTMDYIFVLAEPLVAVLSAISLAYIVEKTGVATAAWWGISARIWPGLILVPTFISVLAFPGLRFEFLTLKELSYENDTEGVVGAANFIQAHSEPGDLILAPPYYAYFTGRILPAECSSSYIWFMRWYNDTQTEQEDREVTRFLETVAEGLETGSIKLVFLNKNQFGLIPEIRDGVQANYEQVSRIQSLNEDLGVFIPRQLTH